MPEQGMHVACRIGDKYRISNVSGGPEQGLRLCPQGSRAGTRAIESTAWRKQHEEACEKHDQHRAGSRPTQVQYAPLPLSTTCTVRRSIARSAQKLQLVKYCMPSLTRSSYGKSPRPSICHAPVMPG